EMKQTEHYRMYTEVFGIDVPLTQSQPTESTHGTHRTTSAPRYGYIKNHKKTVKNGQARTRESEEYKAEARKVKPQSKSAKKSQTLTQALDTSSMEEAQVSLKRIATLAIRVRSLIDPTAKIFDPMIMTMSGED
ncbi:hypothetical protein Tco_1526791, partial [Tanacetum coccineum]